MIHQKQFSDADILGHRWNQIMQVINSNLHHPDLENRIREAEALRLAWHRALRAETQRQNRKRLEGVTTDDH